MRPWMLKVLFNSIGAVLCILGFVYSVAVPVFFGIVFLYMAHLTDNEGAST